MEAFKQKLCAFLGVEDMPKKNDLNLLFSVAISTQVGLDGILEILAEDITNVQFLIKTVSEDNIKNLVNEMKTFYPSFSPERDEVQEVERKINLERFHQSFSGAA